MSSDSPSNDATSLSLLERVQGNDQEAWARLVLLYGPLVYRWCRKASVSGDDAADVVQEVFRAVASGLGQLRRSPGEGSFRGWLFGITRHKVTDHFRKVTAGPRVIGGTTMQQCLADLPAGDELPQAELTDDSDLLEEDRILLVRRALELVRNDFEDKNWQAFWRTTVGQESSTEVAADLGLTANAVRQAKYRILRRLRRELEELGDW